jgi:hypothetical protein
MRAMRVMSAEIQQVSDREKSAIELRREELRFFVSFIGTPKGVT